MAEWAKWGAKTEENPYDAMFGVQSGGANTALERKVSNLTERVKDVGAKPKPFKMAMAGLEKIFNIMDTGGTPVRTSIYNLVKIAQGGGVDDLKSYGKELGKAATGKRHIQGSDILEELGVENKWGKLGGGLAIDIATDPLTYLSSGYSAATKESVASILGKVGGSTVDDLARHIEGVFKAAGVVDSTGTAKKAAEAVFVKAKPLVGKSGKIRPLRQGVGKAGAKIDDEVISELFRQVGRGLGDKGGLKASIPFVSDAARRRSISGAGGLLDDVLKPRTIVPDQPARDVAASALRRAVSKDKGGRLFKSAVSELNSVRAASERSAGEYGEAVAKEIADLIPDANLRRDTTIAIGRRATELNADLAKATERLSSGKEAYRAAAKEGASEPTLKQYGAMVETAKRDLAALFEDANDRRHWDEVFDAFGLTPRQKEAAIVAGKRYQQRMAENQTRMIASGMKAKDLGIVYLKGMPEFGGGKQQISSEAAEWMTRRLGIDPSSLRDQEAAKAAESITANVPDWLSNIGVVGKPINKAKEYLTPEARALALKRTGEEATDVGMKTEFDLAKLAGAATSEAQVKAARSEFAGAVNELVRGAETPDLARRYSKLARKIEQDTLKGSDNLFWRATDAATNYFRKAATVLNVGGYYPRNFWSNKLMLFERDILDPKTYPEAWAIWTKYKSGALKLTDEGADADLLRELLDNGVMGKGVERMELIGKASTRPGKVGGGLAQLNEWVENPDRIAGYLAAKKRGLTPRAAARLVDDALLQYDPKLLSTFEQTYVRRAVPFYTWARRRTPRAVETLFKEPGKLGWVGHLQREGEAVTGEENAAKPQWLEDLFPVALPTEGGTTYVPLANIVPIGELGDIVDAFRGFRTGGLIGVAENVGREVGGRTAPIFKDPVELAFNRDLYKMTDLTGVTKAPRFFNVLDRVAMATPGVKEGWQSFKRDFNMATVANEDGSTSLMMNAKSAKILRDAFPHLESAGRAVDTQDPAIVNQWIKMLMGATSIKAEPEKWQEQQLYESEDKLSQQLKDLKSLGLPVRTMDEIQGEGTNPYDSLFAGSK